MIEITVPCDPAVKAIASVVGFLTDGLDAVALDQWASVEKPGHMTIKITGNSRDLGIVQERAERLK